jgi:hypothetical protein
MTVEPFTRLRPPLSKACCRNQANLHNLNAVPGARTAAAGGACSRCCCGAGTAAAAPRRGGSGSRVLLPLGLAVQLAPWSRDSVLPVVLPAGGGCAAAAECWIDVGF